MTFFEMMYNTRKLGGPDEDVPIYDRPLDEVMKELFSEQRALQYATDYGQDFRRRTRVEKLLRTALGNGPTIRYTLCSSKGDTPVCVKEAVFGSDTFFSKDGNLLDIGSGGGSADVELGKTHPDMQIYALEYEYGSDRISNPKSSQKNVHYIGGDWNALPFAAQTFDNIISCYGIPHYLNARDKGVISEIDRCAKLGCVFRAKTNSDPDNLANLLKFAHALVQKGWRAWVDEHGVLVAEKIAEKRL